MEWTMQQIREAFPFEQIPRYLLRDRDRIFGGEFQKQLKNMGFTEVLSAPRAPWQRAYVERVIGTIRRKRLDHVIVCGDSTAPSSWLPLATSLLQQGSRSTNRILQKYACDLEVPMEFAIPSEEQWRAQRHAVLAASAISSSSPAATRRFCVPGTLRDISISGAGVSEWGF